MARHGRIRRCWAGIALAAMLLLLPATVWAHSRFEWAEPPAGSRLDSSPVWLRAWFTTWLEPGSAMLVTGPAGRADAGDSGIVGIDSRVLYVELLPDLPDGNYLVEWYTVANDDGHAHGGSYGFSIDRSQPPSLAPGPPPPTLVAFGVSLGLLAIGGGGAWLVHRREPDRPHAGAPDAHEGD